MSSSRPLLTAVPPRNRGGQSDVKMIAVGGCAIVIAVMCVCSLIGISCRIWPLEDKQQTVEQLGSTLIFKEFAIQPHNDLFADEEHASLTEDDFVSASKVSPWSYLESRDNQQKQATITLNTILRPNLLDEQLESEAPFEIEDMQQQQGQQNVSRLVKSDFEPTITSKPKAAIVYLLNPKKCCVVDSIQLLFENFNRRFRYPIKIFHESDITAEAIFELLKPVLKHDEIDLLSAHQIQFPMPPNMTLERFTQFRENAEAPLDKLKRFKIGYSHMIRFFFKELFNREDIQQLDFILRLDTDSYITSEITYDVFQHMQDRKYKYGYMGSSFDGLKVTIGMPELFQNYMDSHKDIGEKVTRNLHLWKNGTHLKGEYKKMTGVWPFRTSQPLIYNNFEIVNIPTFQSEAVRSFVDLVDATNNIYWLRWGDAVLRFFEMMAFLNVDQDIYCFVSDFGYKHQTYKSLPKHLQDDPFYANFTIPSKRTTVTQQL